MENRAKVNYGSYGTKGDVGNSRHHLHAVVSQPEYKKRGFYGALYHYFNRYLPTSNLKKMAEGKAILWIVYHCLGTPLVLLYALPQRWLSLLDINVVSIPQPFQAILGTLACLYFASVVFRSIQKGWHMHLKNKDHHHEQKKRFAADENY